MVKLAVTVVAIALPDCINPTLIGGELFVATGAHPRRRTATSTLGALTLTFLSAWRSRSATSCTASLRSESDQRSASCGKRSGSASSRTAFRGS